MELSSDNRTHAGNCENLFHAVSRCNQNFEAEDVFPVSSDIDCSKKVKEHFENTPHLKGEKIKLDISTDMDWIMC